MRSSLSFVLIIFVSLLCAQSTDGDYEIFSQQIKTMNAGDTMPFKILLAKIKDKISKDYISSHFIKVGVTTDVVSCSLEKENCNDPLNLKGIFYRSTNEKKNHEKMITDLEISKPIKIEDGKFYYYLIYDLCYVTVESALQVFISMENGSHSVEVKVIISSIDDFKVNCVSEDSDIFTPRRYHGACMSFNHNIWVFGGKGQSNTNETELSNDLLYYNDNENKWITVNHQTKISPEPRFGMKLFCYYNYLIMFGGEGENGKVHGDLWIFDIIRSYWYKILDSTTLYDVDENLEKESPKSRVFYGGEILVKYGTAIIIGGKGEDDSVICDIWSLDIEKAIQQIEDQNPKITKMFNRIPIPVRNKDQLCRYGLETTLIDETTLLIFGGGANSRTSRSVIFNILTNQLSELKSNGEAPSNRFHYGMLDSGNGVSLLFGGKEESSYINNTLSDFWMLKTNKYNNSIKYIKYNTKSEMFNMLFAWREGFSIHHSPTLNHPIVIGGGFGNNQQSQALLLLPTIVCENYEDFLKDHCTPCSRGSYYNPSLKECEWCTMEQFFSEDFNNYFKSKCKFCPPGTIGSQSGGCTACQPGYIYDPEIKGSCRLCADDKFCPFATKFAFSKTKSDNPIESIQYLHSPEIYKEMISKYDNSTVWVLVAMVVLYAFIYSAFFICIFCNATRKYGIKILKEIDLNPITGGDKRLVIGGVITIFYCVFLCCCSTAIIMKYFMFNERVEASELSNISSENNLPEAYSLTLTVNFRILTIFDH